MATKAEIPTRIPRKLTPKGKVIFEVLKELESHPTVEELLVLVRRKRPDISLSTLYRNLERMVQMGLVRKILTPSSARYDARTSPHYHLRCLCCGRVWDLTREPLPEVQRIAELVDDFEILDHSLEFVGICSECSLDEE